MAGPVASFCIASKRGMAASAVIAARNASVPATYRHDRAGHRLVALDQRDVDRELVTARDELAGPIEWIDQHEPGGQVRGLAG